MKNTCAPSNPLVMPSLAARGVVLARTATLVSALLAAQSGWAQTFTILDRFKGSTDGNGPNSALIQATDGRLYATTLFGGANGDGVAYRITPAGKLTVVQSLNAPITYSIFAGLIQATDGNFYSTGQGGANGNGTVIKITPAGTLTTLYSFCAQASCTDGAIPAAGLIQAGDGNFYGTTSGGGASGNGTVFKITPGGALTTLYSFCSLSACTDGVVPTTPLIQASDGNLYGTTQQGGANGNYGTVFKVTYDGALTTLYSFCTLASCADGKYSLTGLIQGNDGNLYGTTYQGGTGGTGTVFQLTPGGLLTTLHSFCSATNCADGSTPSSLIQATDGNLYGTTSGGGTNGGGSVFSITTSGTLTTLYNSCSQTNCADGNSPSTGLLQATNGTLYGTAFYGGTGNLGTVFSLSVGLGPFVALHTTAGPVGAAVKILGTAITNVSSVTFNGTAATFVVVSPSEIVAKVPAGATTGIVQVVTSTGTLSSNVAYTVQGKSGLPSFSPRAGTYTGAQTVRITDTSPGAVFYYTTDGTAPTTASAQYRGSIIVAASETLKAIAIAPGFALSAVRTAKYTIQ